MGSATVGDSMKGLGEGEGLFGTVTGAGGRSVGGDVGGKGAGGVETGGDGSTVVGVAAAPGSKMGPKISATSSMNFLASVLYSASKDRSKLLRDGPKYLEPLKQERVLLMGGRKGVL